MPTFKQQAEATKFAIEEPMGFWSNDRQHYTQNIEEADTFNWLQYPDYIGEMMETAAAEKGFWFRVHVVVPFADEVPEDAAQVSRLGSVVEWLRQKFFGFTY
jgi:hypothetical protein